MSSLAEIKSYRKNVLFVKVLILKFLPYGSLTYAPTGPRLYIGPWAAPTSKRRGYMRYLPSRISWEWSKGTTSGKWHGIQTDKVYNFYWGHFQVRSKMTSQWSKSKNGGPTYSPVFSSTLTVNILLNTARELLAELLPKLVSAHCIGDMNNMFKISFQHWWCTFI